jgi:hypothetical protein
VGFNLGEMWCIYWHRTLKIVHDYGKHQRVRCPKCGREYGIHHDVHTVLPWRLIGPELDRTR